MGTLYVVATPIGNLQDVSQRCAEVLNSVSLVAAEDTRVTRKLLNHIGSKSRTISRRRTPCEPAPGAVTAYAQIASAIKILLGDRGNRLANPESRDGRLHLFRAWERNRSEPCDARDDAVWRPRPSDGVSDRRQVGGVTMISMFPTEREAKRQVLLRRWTKCAT